MFKIGITAFVVIYTTSVVYETVKYIRNNSNKVNENNENVNEDAATSFETENIIGQEDILTFLHNGDLNSIRGFEYLTDPNMVYPLVVNIDGSTIGAYTLLPQFILTNPTLVLGMVSNLTVLVTDSQMHLHLYLLNCFKATMPITTGGWSIFSPQIISALPDYGVMNLHLTSSVVHDFSIDLSIDYKAEELADRAKKAALKGVTPPPQMDALEMVRAAMGYTTAHTEVADYVANADATVPETAAEIWGNLAAAEAEVVGGGEANAAE